MLEELNVALVAFSPMANGFLTGAYSPKTKFEGAQDYRGGMPQYTPEGYEKDRAVLGLIGDLARERNATMAQISLAWMLCKKPWIIPIPGSRKPERLRENLGAAQVSLTAEEVARIDAALDGMDLAVFGGHARAWGPARVQARHRVRRPRARRLRHHLDLEPASRATMPSATSS